MKIANQSKKETHLSVRRSGDAISGDVLVAQS